MPAQPDRADRQDRRHQQQAAEDDPAGDAPDRRVDRWGQQGQIAPHRRHAGRGRDHQGDIDIDRHRHGDVVDEHGVGEGYQRHGQQKQQVEQGRWFAELFDMAKDEAVRRPEGGQGAEADRIANDLGAKPLDQHAPGSVPMLRQAQFDDQQGDGYGEHAVGKEDQAFQVVGFFRCLVSLHRISPARPMTRPGRVKSSALTRLGLGPKYAP